MTVHSVKVKELPELDDEFAQSASEYDTLGEFRAGTRTQLEIGQADAAGGQARDRALEALLDRIDIPLPERLVASEIESGASTRSTSSWSGPAPPGTPIWSRGPDSPRPACTTEIAADARRS